MSDEMVTGTQPERPSGPPVTAGAHVAIQVSKGTPPAPHATLAAPTAIGLKQPEAMELLQGAGFEIEVVRNPSDTYKAGIVSHQLPVPASLVSQGSKVVVIVSSGPALETAPMTVLPDVVGKTREEAAGLMADASLKASVIEDFSATVPAGVVMAQEPNARTLNRGPEKKRSLTWLWVVLALVVVAGVAYFAFAGGGKEVAVPNLAGLTVAEAETALTEVGLEIGRETTEATTAAEPGSVLSQDPEAGTVASEGDRVDIVVAEALAGVEVPDVVGMTVLEATAELDEAGFVSRVDEVFDANVAKGDVIDQSPRPGTRVEEGTEIALSVSKGPEPAQNVAVPSLTGMTEDAAKAALKDVGLGSSVVLGYSSSVPEGQVFGQAPAAGSQVAPGTSVVMLISQGAPPASATTIEVPDVVGMTRAAAEQALKDAGLKVESAEFANADVPKDQVFAQLPLAGDIAVEGSVVAIGVSQGPGTE